MCKKCHRFYKTTDLKLEGHRCDKIKCGNCKEFVNLDHQCYMLKKDIKPHSEKYIFFNFEAKLDPASPTTLMVRKPYSIKSVNSVNGYLTNQDTKDTHFLLIMLRGMTFSLLQNG